MTRITIVGAGFSGLGMAIRLRQAGFEDVRILERGTQVGGTWRDNTYPGCACDVPSVLYSFSFAPNPEWSHSYAPASEILAYLKRLTRDHGLEDRLELGCDLRGGGWNADRGMWELDTSTGPHETDVLICATGPLIEPVIPELDGLGDFAGPAFHSAAWEHEHHLAGKRVAVVGTGASAVQIVPHLQRHAEHVTLFQRTPAWVMPKLDHQTSLLERALLRVPGVVSSVRTALWSINELLGLGFHAEPRLLAPAERVARMHLARQVKDPKLREKLTPDFRLGCKRILASNDYYRALAAPNASVVTDAIRRVTPEGIIDAADVEHPIDAIVFATGFRVPVGPAMDRLRGRFGTTVADLHGADDVEGYLGAAYHGFPNLFTILGPNTGIGHNSLLVMIEAQIDYVVGAVRALDGGPSRVLDVRADVQRVYNEQLQQHSARTVWLTGGCASWYLNEEGKNTTLWPRSTAAFIRRTRRFAVDDYDAVPVPA